MPQFEAYNVDEPMNADTGGFNPADFEGDGANAFEKNCPGCTVLNPIDASYCYLCSTSFAK